MRTRNFAATGRDAIDETISGRSRGAAREFFCIVSTARRVVNEKDAVRLRWQSAAQQYEHNQCHHCDRDQRADQRRQGSGRSQAHRHRDDRVDGGRNQRGDNGGQQEVARHVHEGQHRAGGQDGHGELPSHVQQGRQPSAVR